ncbi:MAG: hypothetical protein J5743_00975 [Victivallales bacterium]|nr:hypothetical protein [Victivallales bacterium]
MQNRPCPMNPSSSPDFLRRRLSEAQDSPLLRQYMKNDTLMCIWLPDGTAVSSICEPKFTAPSALLQPSPILCSPLARLII